MIAFMKRLIVFVLLLCCVATTLLVGYKSNPLFNLEGVERVCFVSNRAYDDLESVNCGDLVFNFCTMETAKQNLKRYTDGAKALQFYFEDVSKEVLLKKLMATVICESEVEGVTVIVAYTPYYQDCIFVDNKKANLQLAEKDGQLVAGFPAILTGF